MFSKVYSGGIWGIEGYLVEVEADASNGLPCFSMVGFLAAEVREAQERVRTALRNSGYSLPARKVTVNLSPANRRKEGTAYDVSIAVAVLAAYGAVFSSLLESSAFVGEIGLNGEIKPVYGALSLITAFRDEGLTYCFLPEENLAEVQAIKGIRAIGVHSLAELIRLLNGEIIPAAEPAYKTCEDQQDSPYDIDFCEINGQLLLKRAAEIAVAGKHNLLMIGPAGSGKSMLAQRIPTIMPEFSEEEQLETSKIYSICGLLLDKNGLLRKRPFRSPHHTVSAPALAGGGRTPRPGELSLASGGVLFLDELTEFKRSTIEILRQPLEERKVVISRVYGSCEFPANIMLVAALNPCPCGHYPDREKCSCSDLQVRRYLQRISKPILDRIDICVEAAPLTFDEIRSSKSGEQSVVIRKRIETVRQIQKERYAGRTIHFNSEMKHQDIQRFCWLKERDSGFLKKIFEASGISARGYHKILKVARTIADLDGRESISKSHLCEAIGYRQLEQKYWSGHLYGE